MFVLTSPGFGDAQTMPSKYAKSPAVGGENLSPPLSWDGSPRHVKSFALAVVDRHPVARNYVHWLVADISAEVTSLEQGASGHGAMPVGSRELKAYTGPNPPSGSHAYEFTIYALATKSLDLTTPACPSPIQ